MMRPRRMKKDHLNGNEKIGGENEEVVGENEEVGGENEEVV